MFCQHGKELIYDVERQHLKTIEIHSMQASVGLRKDVLNERYSENGSIQNVCHWRDKCTRGRKLSSVKVYSRQNCLKAESIHGDMLAASVVEAGV